MVETPERAFLVSVDEAGQFLVVPAGRLVLGHLHGGQADLPLLADVGVRHARLERRDTFRSGTVWSIEPLDGERLEVNGVAARGEVELAPGDRVRLGQNLAFRFELPDPASQSALLGLLEGAECRGAQGILLLAPGDAGRVRIGPLKHAHVKAFGLEQEVTLVQRGDRLELTSSLPILSPAMPEEDAGRLVLPLPLGRRFDLSLGRREGGRPPFSLGLAPVDDPRASPRLERLA